MTKQMHLNLFIHSRGHHEASWRHPDASPLPLTNVQYYADLAQKAEAGLFDSIFLADQLALGDDVARADYDVDSRFDGNIAHRADRDVLVYLHRAI
jgi:alkanesulfonate monooxygenase SsuD/methylene tetrahydromethanopterin reductase-like flavin-dependent oxidoreductase (luciferase family)